MRAETQACILGQYRVCLEQEAPFVCSYALAREDDFYNSLKEAVWISYEPPTGYMTAWGYFFPKSRSRVEEDGHMPPFHYDLLCGSQWEMFQKERK